MRALPTTRSRAAGFTLIEVMIALAIFSIGVLGMIPLFAQATAGARTSRELTQATKLAQTYIDKIRNAPFGNIGPCTLPCEAPDVELPANYQVRWTVTGSNGGAYTGFTSPSPPMPNVKRVEVIVNCSTCLSPRLRDTSQGIRMVTLVAARS
jgi:type IV pilus assembly protein PilV